MNVLIVLVSVNKGVSILKVAMTVNVGLDINTLMILIVKVVNNGELQ